MDISKEFIEKAKTCKTAEELLALAQENELEISLEEAEYALKEFEEGAISDEELDNVAGGQDGCGSGKGPYPRKYWRNKDEVQFIFDINERVECYVFGSFKNRTATAKVVNRMVEKSGDFDYYDRYWTEKVGGGDAPLVSRWRSRDEIEQK